MSISPLVYSLPELFNVPVFDSVPSVPKVNSVPAFDSVPVPAFERLPKFSTWAPELFFSLPAFDRLA